MTVVEVLRATRERLVQKGWSSGIGRCLYMTVEAVAPSDGLLLSEDARAALAVLREVIGEEITSWNARQTSIDPVLAAVDAAIERAQR